LVVGEGRASGSLSNELQRGLQLARIALEALAVERVAPHEMLAQHAGRPDAELGAALGFHAVSDGDDDVEVVVVDLARDAAAALDSNLCKFCTGCLGVEFTLREGVADVLGHDGALTAEKLGHLLLAQPDRLGLESDVEADPAIASLEHDHFAAVRLVRAHAVPPASPRGHSKGEGRSRTEVATRRSAAPEHRHASAPWLVGHSRICLFDVITSSIGRAERP